MMNGKLNLILLEYFYLKLEYITSIKYMIILKIFKKILFSRYDRAYKHPNLAKNLTF